jgi:hypothetical protein
MKQPPHVPWLAAKGDTWQNMAGKLPSGRLPTILLYYTAVNR